MRMIKMAVLGVAIAFSGTTLVHAHDHAFSFGMPSDSGKAARIVKIAMLDLSFQPASVTVKAGETVRFVVTNTSSVDHDFTLGDAKVQADHRAEMAEMAKMGGDMAAMHASMGGDDPNAVFVKAGETKELTWTFGKAMHLEFACNIPGHYEAGMRGTITVR